MREIKFRAWDSVNEEMGEVADISWHNFDNGFDVRVSSRSYDDCVNFDILMQYTGLHDKNGREIYEGDIVRYDDHIYPVEFAYSAWCVHKETSYESMDYETANGRVEVIGNIYESPELLN